MIESLLALLVKRAICCVRGYYFPVLACLVPFVMFVLMLYEESRFTKPDDVDDTDNRRDFGARRASRLADTGRPSTIVVSLSSIYPSSSGFVVGDNPVASMTNRFQILLESEGASVETFDPNAELINQLNAYQLEHQQFPLILGGEFRGKGPIGGAR